MMSYVPDDDAKKILDLTENKLVLYAGELSSVRW